MTPAEALSIISHSRIITRDGAEYLVIERRGKVVYVYGTQNTIHISNVTRVILPMQSQIPKENHVSNAVV